MIITNGSWSTMCFYAAKLSAPLQKKPVIGLLLLQLISALVICPHHACKTCRQVALVWLTVLRYCGEAIRVSSALPDFPCSSGNILFKWLLNVHGLLWFEWDQLNKGTFQRQDIIHVWSVRRKISITDFQRKQCSLGRVSGRNSP